MGLYNESNGVSIPESLIFFIAYHTAASQHVVRGPCGEVRACRSASPCRIYHVGGPVVRGRDNITVCGQQRTLFRYISNKGERDGGARAMLTSRSDYHEVV
ncbi:hypothetical protein B296_00006195 [Ensete ventricosum]|uniref:Uncharacterized protein n=1 Tax=Ensete ventricosum TaxID=4639 RepID=A0A427APD5_ENSVE|nr:hypothetical protein B296_00006195 [Ensete ventricosum]